MKRRTLLFTFAATLALGLAGCSKNEPVTTAADDANKADEAAQADAAKTAAAAQAEAARVADAAKAEAARTAEAAKVTEAARVETAKTQGLIDKAKSLVAESKFSDASSVIQQLTGRSLTSEQTKLVDALKEQIQKALAAKAAGNLLK